MKKLIKLYIAIILAISSIVLIIANVLLDITISKIQHKSVFDTNLNQVVSILESNNQELLDFEEKLINDYLSRCKTFVYLINEYPELINNTENLKELATALDVDELNIIDNNGIITNSSFEHHIGFDMDSGEQSREFLDLLDYDSDLDYIFQDIQLNVLDKEPRSYIGMKRLDNNGIVQVGLYPERILEFRNQKSYKKVIERIVPKGGTTVFLLDSNTGEIIGQSNNNELNLYSEKSVDEMIDTLLSLSSGGTLKYNGKNHYTVTKKYNDLILVASISMDALYQNISWHILFVTIGIIILSTLIIISLNLFIEHKVINDINKITNSLSKIKNGDSNLRLTKNNTIELNEISTSINQMLSAFNRTNLRINKIINITESPIAFFEYTANLNQFFVTDNIHNILNIKKESLIKFDKNSAFYLINKLKENPFKYEHDVYIHENKFIKLILFTEENDFFGSIQDVTNDIKKKQEILTNLKESELLAKTDSLTGLLNLRAITEVIENTLNDQSKNGVFLLFDIDNFKSVNDSKGHLVGDKLLIEFSKFLSDKFTNNSFISRIGGDEFVIFLNDNIDSNSLKDKLSSLLINFKYSFNSYYTELNVSLSIGAIIINNTNYTFKELYSIADKNLYIAKKNGKNQFYIN